MHHLAFDDHTRTLLDATSRRAALCLIASRALGALVGLPGLTSRVAGKKNKNKSKNKKVTLCLDGRTIRAGKKKKKKLLKNGASPGACPPATPLPPPSSCPLHCAGVACGCGANALCHQGVCHACTVVCEGDAAACGATLGAALTNGGTIYACPGQYVGAFSLTTDVDLIGAGDGQDPATSTILDANQNGRVLNVHANVSAELRGLRLTGGNVSGAFGGGIYVDGTLAMTACSVIGNTAPFAGGIYHNASATGPLTLTNCKVTGNTATIAGGAGMVQSSSGHPMTLIDSVVSENDASTEGGGIAVTQGLAELKGSAITANRSGSHGAGLSIYLTGGVTFDKASSVIANVAGDLGGGIYLQGGTIFLNGADVSGNFPDECFPADVC